MPSLLTTARLAQSDRLVFHDLRERKIPVAWDLAGGYPKPIAKVIAIHENTIGACIAAWERP